MSTLPEALLEAELLALLYSMGHGFGSNAYRTIRSEESHMADQGAKLEA